MFHKNLSNTMAADALRHQEIINHDNCRINRFAPSTWNDFKYLCHVSVENWENLQMYFELFWCLIV